MALDLRGVHKEDVAKDGHRFVKSVAPYKRWVKEGDIPVIVQRGRFYGDGGAPISVRDLPDHVLKGVRNMTEEAKALYGLSSFDPDRRVQSLNKPEVHEAPEDKRPELADILMQLDHDEDSHWTKSGLPDLNHLKEQMRRYISRAEVDKAIPGLKRKQEE